MQHLENMKIDLIFSFIFLAFLLLDVRGQDQQKGILLRKLLESNNQNSISKENATSTLGITEISIMEKSDTRRPCGDFSATDPEDLNLENVDCIPLIGSEASTIQKTLTTLEKFKKVTTTLEPKKSNTENIAPANDSTHVISKIDNQTEVENGKEEVKIVTENPDLKVNLGKIPTTEKVPISEITTMEIENNSPTTTPPVIENNAPTTSLPIIELTTLHPDNTKDVNKKESTIILSSSAEPSSNKSLSTLINNTPTKSLPVIESTSQIGQMTTKTELKEAHTTEIQALTTIIPDNVTDIKKEEPTVNPVESNDTTYSTVSVVFNDTYIGNVTVNNETNVTGAVTNPPKMKNPKSVLEPFSSKTASFGTINIRLSTLVAAWAGGFFGTFVLISILAAYVKSQENKKGKKFKLQQNNKYELLDYNGETAV